MIKINFWWNIANGLLVSIKFQMVIRAQKDAELQKNIQFNNRFLTLTFLRVFR